MHRRPHDRRPRRLRRLATSTAASLVLAASSALGLLGGAGPTPAGAATSASPGAGTTGAGTTGAVTQDVRVTGSADPLHPAAYWTPARMRSARAVALLGTGASTRTASTSSGSTAGSTSRPASVSAPASVPSTTGKLFFTSGGTDYVCSASSVTSPGKNLVITAGHCIYDEQSGLTSTNVVYVPRYRDGSAPLGVWSGTRTTTFRSWRQYGDFTYDQAFVRVAKLNGRSLTTVTGGSALQYGYGRTHTASTIWGWPAQDPYDGSRAYACTGSTFGSGDDAAMQCPMTGGASGGPWWTKGSTASSSKIWAVTSRRTLSGTPYLLAVPFGSSVQSLYGVVKNG